MANLTRRRHPAVIDLLEEFSWFNREKYERQDKFGSAEWAAELSFRLLMKTVLDAGNTAAYDEGFLSIKRDGLITPLGGVQRSGRTLDEKLRTQRYASTVTSLELRDILPIYDSTKEKWGLMTEFREWGEVMFNATEKAPPGLQSRKALSEIYDAFAKRQFEELSTKSPRAAVHLDPTVWQGYAHAVVDLDATNKTIKADFGKWLTSAKKSLEIGTRWKAFTKAQQFRSWRDSHVLAYLDLTQWAKRTGKKISNVQIANAVLPPGDYKNPGHKLLRLHAAGERIRKYTNPFAKAVLNRHVIRMLEQSRIPYIAIGKS